MKFSILIAHYNNWDYFQDCYQSIRQQTYQDFEIVIVDDFSLDGSYENLLKLSNEDSSIRLFRNEENKKVGFTKKRCIEEATGEICGFLDPDDLLQPNAIELAIKYYENNEDCIATYSKIELIDENLNSKGVFNSTRKVINKKKDFFNINFEVAHFFTFKKNVYLQTSGINQSLSSAVDQDLYLKLYEVGDFYFIDKVCYLYRIHTKGVSQDKLKKSILNSNWNQVLLDTCKRRNITKLYNKNIDEIDNISSFIKANENSVFKRILSKIFRSIKI